MRADAKSLATFFRDQGIYLFIALAVELEGVGHGERVRMAWNRDHVFGAEDRSLFENAAVNFSQRQAIRSRIEVLEAASGLDGLKRDAADAILCESEIDYFSDFPVIQSFLQRDHESRVDGEAIEALESLFGDRCVLYKNKNRRQDAGATHPGDGCDSVALMKEKADDHGNEQDRGNAHNSERAAVGHKKQQRSLAVLHAE
jgi:hypothetical protein